MTDINPPMKMPELLVFARVLAVGLVGAEVWRAAFSLGSSLPTILTTVPLWAVNCLLLAGIALCLTYAFRRRAHLAALRMCRSLRLDLLVAISIGIWAGLLASPWLDNVHQALRNADPHWGLVVLALLCLALLSPVVRQRARNHSKAMPLPYFIADAEIEEEAQDLLEIDAQAKSFAEAVLGSGAHPGLVFGIDGPWGVGKSSFINLADSYWSKEDKKVIVCRFEPLRHASEPDITDRLIRDLSAAIQRTVFAPEFRPAASRYSRLIKGKADVSFLGFKLSLEPSHETVDELLDDIDDVLKRIDRRVIVVIDDLDRLDTATVNNVLSATRRTFSLSQATYVLCYDTEILASQGEQSVKAREFLEKFVTVKLSLFVDSSSIRDFLQGGWQRKGGALDLIPSDTMLKLSAVLSELAKILASDVAPNYLPLVGDLRKIKRLVNAMLLMQIEKSNLDLTDFNKRDLINLILLHLHYPGVFRRLYSEETDGRRGTFSVHRSYEEREFRNADGFAELVEEAPGSSAFLLRQLFDVQTLEIGPRSDPDEALLASRACFNQEPSRNLERYLRLIVRFLLPEPQDTYALYRDAVDRIRRGTSVASVLESSNFVLKKGEKAHDQFWRVLVNQSYDLNDDASQDSIDTLVDYLPRYSAVVGEDHGLRRRSIYSLLRLLDRAGWGRTPGRRRANTAENVIEIAWRIFGEHSYTGRSLLERLCSADRGVLGWDDLMLFRLTCSQDRQGQLYNVSAALIAHEDITAPTTGLVSALAVMEMRRLSQRVFSLFKNDFIDTKKNFFTEVDVTPAASFLGESLALVYQQPSTAGELGADYRSLAERLSLARTIVKAFVIYQLANYFGPTGSGVGCGYFDEQGDDDGHGIAAQMNEYLFGFCFNPAVNQDNIFHFLDHCLSNLSSTFFSARGEEEGYAASRTELARGLDPKAMGRYWGEHRELIRERSSSAGDRRVVTSSYVASYNEDLLGVFAVLDELADEAAKAD